MSKNAYLSLLSATVDLRPWFLYSLYTYEPHLLRRYQYHPGNAELIGHHPESRGEESLRHWHTDFSTFSQRGKVFLGLGVGVDRQRE